MTDVISDNFVRQQIVEQRAAPTNTTGIVGWIRTRLLTSPTYILLTFVCALILWFTIVPLIRFTLIDAVWTGRDRGACLAETV